MAVSPTRDRAFHNLDGPETAYLLQDAPQQVAEGFRCRWTPSTYVLVILAAIIDLPLRLPL